MMGLNPGSAPPRTVELQASANDPAIDTISARWACSTAVSAGDSSIKVPSRGNARSGRDEFRETFGLPCAAHGNPEPSRAVHRRKVQRLPEGSSALNDRLEHPAPTRTVTCAGEEIVHSRRKRRGKVNPLVVGSNPTGPIEQTRSSRPAGPTPPGTFVARHLPAGRRRALGLLDAYPARRLGSSGCAHKRAAHGQQETRHIPRQARLQPTAEPSGQRSRVRRRPSLRFVIQKHAARRLHYDLRLELDGVFKSWAVTRGPSLDPARQAPGGGGRGPSARLRRLRRDHSPGPVRRRHGAAVGPRLLGAGGPRHCRSKALAAGELKFVMEGERLHGGWVLVRLRDRAAASGHNWLLIKHRDEFARAGDGDGAGGGPLGGLGPDHGGDRGRQGPRPKPFMTAGRAAQADAVWHPNATPRRAAGGGA